MRSSGLFPFALTLFVAAASGFVTQTRTSVWEGAIAEIADAAPPPIAIASKTACAPGEVLQRESTSDGRLVTRCLPGQKTQSCGPGEVLHRESTPDGRVVTWRDEEWLVSGTVSPRRAVQTSPDGRRFETAMTRDGLAELYDPASNTIYAAPVLLPRASGPGSKAGEDEGLTRRLLSPQGCLRGRSGGHDKDRNNHKDEQDETHGARPLSRSGLDALRLVGVGQRRTRRGGLLQRSRWCLP